MNLTVRIILFAALSTSSAAAKELGRLFFTPQQRAQLEQRQSAASTANAHILRVDGIVQKHGGRRTVWINGVPQQTDKAGTSASVPLTLSGQTRPIEVKVGQKLLVPPEQP